MMDKIVVVGVSVLCVSGIITIPQYVHFMEQTIVVAVLSCVFLTIIVGFISVLWGNS